MNIGIIGQGFVGNAIYQRFKNYYDIFTYDLDVSKCNSSIQKAMDNEIVFVCLPTPMNPDGSCNVSIVDETIGRIFKFGVTKIVVIKSTVPPGTTKTLNEKYPSLEIVFNPEFLTEINAVEDFNNTTRIILGGPRKATTILKRIYSKVFAHAHIVKTGSTHAEMVKYVTNTFLATKVSFANEIYQICEGLDIDYDKVIEYATLDKRLGKSHWQVPGPDGDFGFGGHCLPKDTNALISVAENLGIFPEILLSTVVKNDEVRKNKDWEKMKGRAVV